jgi:hypothetical protein
MANISLNNKMRNRLLSQSWDRPRKDAGQAPQGCPAELPGVNWGQGFINLMGNDVFLQKQEEIVANLEYLC